jgi:hypothetical protein
MQRTLKFSIERPAKKAGSDRYQCDSKEFGEFSIYIPQAISREGSQAPAPKMTVVFDPLFKMEE